MLRRWRDTDRAAFHALEQRPAGDGHDRSGDDRGRVRRLHEPDRGTASTSTGFGLWCVELDGEAIGFTGFMVPWFRDGVEIGWRIRSDHWGQRLRTRGGPRLPRSTASPTPTTAGWVRRGHLVHGRDQRDNSRRVMEKLGLGAIPTGDFEHPGVPSRQPAPTSRAVPHHGLAVP